MKTIEDRIREKIPDPDPVTGCQEWMGLRNHGYGYIGLNYKMIRVHRKVWELKHGPIPKGLHVLHRCDNPPCCNLEHLFLGTHQENMDDAKAKGRNYVKKLG